MATKVIEKFPKVRPVGIVAGLLLTGIGFSVIDMIKPMPKDFNTQLILICAVITLAEGVSGLIISVGSETTETIHKPDVI